MAFMNVSYVFQSVQAVAQRMGVGERPIDLPRPDLITRLPHELLDRIFRCVMIPPTGMEIDPKHPMSNRLFFSKFHPISPFFLTQVCRRWRHIAQGAPHLWKSITIVRPAKCLVYPVELWMRFAHEVPLDIALFQQEPKSLDDLEAASDIIDLLGTRYKQWSDVNFHLHQELFPPALTANFKLISNVLWPTLKAATISNRYSFTSSEEEITTAWEALNRIPSLMTLKWRSPNILSRPAAHQLQFLSITAITCRDLIKGLKACGSLREIEARLLPGNAIYDEDPYGNLVRHPHTYLEHFNLTGDSNNIQGFLFQLTLPRLVSVELNVINSDGLNALGSLLHRSNASLTRIILGVQGIGGDQLSACVEWRSFASLKTFSVSGADIDDHILHWLEVHPIYQQRPFYLPNLENLTLSRCVAQIDENLLIRMLASRLFTTRDRPDKTVELMVASIIVQHKTLQMRRYEELWHQMIGSTPKENVTSQGWNQRKIEFKEPWEL